MGGHRLDIDDRPRYFTLDHTFRHILNQEERRFDVDVENLVIARLGGVENGAAIRQSGRVDQHIDTAKVLERMGHNLAAIGQLGKISLHKSGFGHAVGQLFGDPQAIFAIAPANQDALRPRSHIGAGNGLAQPLRAAGDDADFPVQGRRCVARHLKFPE